MEGYHRDSLRELRRAETDRQQQEQGKGSVFVTLLIILMFLGAGAFYLETTDRLPETWNFGSVKQTVLRWKEELVSVFEPEDAVEVHATVDSALAGQDETN